MNTVGKPFAPSPVNFVIEVSYVFIVFDVLELISYPISKYIIELFNT